MLAELTWRFFSGHGPAEVEDLARWASLTRTQVRAGLELVGERLERVVVEGHELWYDPARGGLLRPDEPDPGPAGDRPSVVLAPLFDEVTLSHRGLTFGLAAGHPRPPGHDVFTGRVLVGTEDVGAWRRTVRSRSVAVETWLAPSLPERARAAVAAAVQGFAAFLGRDLQVVPTGAPPPTAADGVAQDA
jgi:hypothetical protein